MWDDQGNRYLDGLAGLFVVQAGHGRQEIADAASRQAAKLGYFPLWTYAHPTAIELADRLADLAPGDLNRVFFTTGAAKRWSRRGSWRQYFVTIGQPERVKVISRQTAPRHHARGAQHHRPRRHQAALPPAAERSGAPCAEHPDGPARQPRRCAGRCRRHRSDDRRGGSRHRRCTSSRCRTRAAASFPRRATSNGCARSATATVCCS